MKKRMLLLATLVLGVLLLATSVTTAQDNQVLARLKPVNNSGLDGAVLLQPQGDGTQIIVLAFGLQQGVNYVSLYYDNHTCELEPYSQEDVIGGNTYTVFRDGVGGVIGTADDSLEEINSVSVRMANNDLTLLACADVHPGS